MCNPIRFLSMFTYLHNYGQKIFISTCQTSVIYIQLTFNLGPFDTSRRRPKHDLLIHLALWVKLGIRQRFDDRLLLLVESVCDFGWWCVLKDLRIQLQIESCLSAFCLNEKCLGTHLSHRNSLGFDELRNLLPHVAAFDEQILLDDNEEYFSLC